MCSKFSKQDAHKSLLYEPVKNHSSTLYMKMCVRDFLYTYSLFPPFFPAKQNDKWERMTVKADFRGGKSISVIRYKGQKIMRQKMQAKGELCVDSSSTR